MMVRDNGEKAGDKSTLEGKSRVRVGSVNAVLPSVCLCVSVCVCAAAACLPVRLSA